MTAENNISDRRCALRRLAGVAGAACAGTDVFWRWGYGIGNATCATEVTLLDARGGFWLTRRSLANAVRVRWQDFAERGPARRGFLLPDLHDTVRRLAGLGIRPDRPTVVVGDGPDGWGEEGRIVWMLWYIGVTNAVPMSKTEWYRVGATFRPGRSDGVAAWVPESDLTLRCSVRDAPPGAVILDARSKDEYLGKSRFGETRGDHVPGSRHLAWDAFFDRESGIYDTAALARHLEARGVSRDSIIVCYCTGGVRSAYLTVRLRQAGLTRAANDDGGMWAYSATDAPLIIGDE
mgnify:CR=1 FL=1